MNKELQDKVWAVLPNEFREEVKKMYNDLLNEHITPDIEDGVNNRMLILEEIFSYHNLTSDTEESTNVASKPKFKVGDRVKVSNGIIGRIYGIGILQPLEYFVLAKEAKGGWYSESDIELYTEPHNVEDETVSKPTHLSDMEEEKSEPAASTLPIRLQVATAAMQGILANGNHRIMDVFINHKDVQEAFTLVAQASRKQADALLAEYGYEKKGD